MEILLVDGINDTDDEIRRLRDACLSIGPDRIQLNTLDRPGTVSGLRPLRREDLERAAGLLSPLTVEITGKPDGGAPGPASAPADHELILGTLSRRPSTADDLARALNMDENEVKRLLDEMVLRGTVGRREGERGVFFFAAGGRV